MIKFIEKLTARMKANFTWLDYSFLKLYGGIFGLIIGSFFPQFVQNNLVVFVSIFLVLMFRYLYLLFFKKENLVLTNQ